MSLFRELWKKIEPHIVQDDPDPLRLKLSYYPYIFEYNWPIEFSPLRIISKDEERLIKDKYAAIRGWLVDKTDGNFAMTNTITSHGIHIAIRNRDDALRFRCTFDVKPIEDTEVCVCWSVFCDSEYKTSAVSYPDDFKSFLDNTT